MNLRLPLALLLLASCSKPQDEAIPTAPSASASASPLPLPSAAPTASAAPAKLPDLKSFPNTADGAKALVTEFMKPNVDAAALTLLLRPKPADYKAVFDAPTAAKIDAMYSPEWDRGSFVVAARPGQTEVKMSSATVADFKANNAKAKEFPGAYSKITPNLVGASTIYRFRFVEPGQTQGNTYDGLIFVNGHWVLIPKPWRGLDDHR